MKYSNGLCLLLHPLFCVTALLPDWHRNRIVSVLQGALKRVGKRGNGTYYPTDLKRINIWLNCIHEDGTMFNTFVNDGNLEAGLERLREAILARDILLHGLATIKESSCF